MAGNKEIEGMKMQTEDFFRAPVWYPILSEHTFTTYFVRLSPQETEALANGVTKGEIPAGVVKRLRYPMEATPGNCFIITDRCAPTDTERFLYKHGAVYSPESAWKILASSAKIRSAAKAGEVEYIGVRPYRRMNRTREFRLFVRNGAPVGMSQYNLARHFRRLAGIRDELLAKTLKWFAAIRPEIPLSDYTLDLYFTSIGQILLIDFNPWGPPTSPLLYNRWERDWSSGPELKLMPEPVKLSGSVNVSF